MSDRPDSRHALEAADCLEELGHPDKADNVRRYVEGETRTGARLASGAKTLSFWTVLVGGAVTGTAGFVWLLLRGDVLAAALALVVSLLVYAAAGLVSLVLEWLREEANDGVLEP